MTILNSNTTYTKSEDFITTWDYNYLAMTVFLGSFSKCAAKQVGCILVKNNNIIASGVNGTPSGFTNCCDIFHREDPTSPWYTSLGSKGKPISLEGTDREYYPLVDNPGSMTHRDFSDRYEVHAEINALAKANKTGVNIEGSTAYTTYSPCLNCTKSLLVGGVKKIVFAYPFDDVDITSQFLDDNNVALIQLDIEGKDLLNGNHTTSLT